jgi:NitT/TauT family transport system substrate-binding protein
MEGLVRRRAMVRRLILPVVGLLLVGLAGPRPGAGQAREVVRVATLKLVGSAPLLWAEDRGYFQREGLRVEFVYFGAAAPVATAVATGNVEAGATGITATLFNLVAGGARLWLVADRGQERPGYPLNAVVVGRQAYDAGIRSLRDLRGRRLGITTLGSTFHYQIAKLLERDRMRPTDVELVPLRELALVVQAVRTGQVTAAILSPPWGAVAEEEGWGKVLFYVGDRLVNQVTGVFYGERLHQDRSLGVRFMTAYVRAAREYHDACLARPPRPSCAAIVRVTARALDQPDSVVQRSLPYIDRDGRLYTLDLERQEAWYLQNGMISRPVPLSRFVDMSFVGEAVRRLGP